jgi:hypothetical protein
MDKRFEQVNKRFEQVDRRCFESMNQKMDSFMKWSLGTLFAFSGLIIGVIKYL